MPINWFQKQFTESKHSQVERYLGDYYVSIFEKKKTGPERKGDLPGVKEEVNEQSQAPTFGIRPSYNSDKLQRGVSIQFPAMKAKIKRKKEFQDYCQQYCNGKHLNHSGLL